ncbi:energy-coupling factor transporter transmembrane component T [Paenibacillus sp. GCM10027627]|uniref:energy-coupling factor transporter transmembrane component T n=1 Tax=unclassified Paenibacillus TaxID=185978 RepID=UPI0036430ADD
MKPILNVYNAQAAAAISASLDPRVKLIQSLLVCAIIFTLNTISASVILFFFMLLFMGLLRLFKPCIVFLIAYSCFFLGWLFTEQAGLDAVSLFAGFLLKSVPLYMMAYITIRTIPVRDFITALSSLKMPKAITLLLTVTFRSLPSIRSEFNYLTDAMKLRGIELSLRNLLSRPLHLFEYILVPLLIRCLKLSDELSMSALTRGIEAPGPHTSLRKLHFTARDMAVMAFSILFVIGLIQLDLHYLYI